MRRLSSAPVAWAALALTFLGVISARAQVVERNLPPAPQAAPQPLAPAPLSSNDADAAPIGPLVRAIVLLDGREPLREAPAEGVTVSTTLRLPAPAARQLLLSKLGQPLSRRLIAQAEAAVAHGYRRLGFPFLAVASPEQEVTSGVLQLRVIEFHVGQVSVQGARSDGEARAIAAGVRLTPGAAIYAPAVSDDLDWLDRNPARKVSPVFSRGSSLGATDPLLVVQDARPFSLYAGSANSGSPSTGRDRYFAGGQVSDLLGFGSLASYQGTASNDALFDKQRPFSAAERPRYVSHAGRLSLQPLARTAVEVAADYVDTNQPVQDFVVNQKTFELAIDVRFALSNVSQSLSGFGDARIGIAGKRQETRTLFNDTDVYDVAVEDYQVQVGWSRAELDRYGRSDFDVLLHLSPGGIDDANGPARLRLASRGRLGDARYAYAGFSLDRDTRLPGRWVWRVEAIGQYAAKALPSTEQAGLGGQTLVRGYTLDDGAYDRTLIVRDELRAPVRSLRPTLIESVSPYVFFDVGYGGALAPRVSHTAAALGVGFSTVLGSRLLIDLDVAQALNTATSTHAGDWTLESRINVMF